MPNPVCVKCKKRMYLKNGVVVLEYMDKTMKRPYKLWNADMAFCRDCGNKVVFQIANRPFAQHFEEGFEQEVNNIKQQALLKQITLVETR